MGERQRRRLRDHGSPVMGYWPNPDPKQVAEDEATTRLRRLVAQRKVIEREIDAEVDRLEGGGFNWPTIARALGVTRQAARRRHRRRTSCKPRNCRASVHDGGDAGARGSGRD
jgi:hypothetical protein